MICLMESTKRLKKELKEALKHWDRWETIRNENADKLTYEMDRGRRGILTHAFRIADVETKLWHHRIISLQRRLDAAESDAALAAAT